MENISKIILDRFIVRKTKRQKTEFIDWLKPIIGHAGYNVNIEKYKSVGSRNIVIGDIENAKVIFTAHYDTPPVLPFPNFITPENVIIYILYQLVLTAFLFLVPIAFSLVAWICTSDGLCAFIAFYVGLALLMYLMLFGKANKNNFNDNTSGVITVLETALAMPESLRTKAAFVLFDNEEQGLIGSASFKNKNSKTIAANKTLVVNFDCVSDGDYIRYYPSKNVRNDSELMEKLSESFVSSGEKELLLGKKVSVFPSDNSNFKRSMVFGAFKKNSVLGLYLDRIHTRRDTQFDEKNISLLRDGAVKFTERL